MELNHSRTFFILRKWLAV